MCMPNSIQYRLVVELRAGQDVCGAFQRFNSNTSTREYSKIDNRESVNGKLDWRVQHLTVESVMGVSKQLRSLTSKDDYNLVTSSYLGRGIIRLFKYSDAADQENEPENGLLRIPGDDTMVSILFVPTYFTVHDLLHYYIGDEIVSNQVSDIRILRNQKSDAGFNFTVLMKFRNPVDAKHFKDEFNGKQFTKVDPETCHIVFIKEIIFTKEMFEDTFLGQACPFPFSVASTVDSKSSRVLELPTCPVCLERLDSAITGLITIPCQHTFHCACIDKWKNSKCPVCRYSSVRLSRDYLMKRVENAACCSRCNSKDNLWICLICGHIGCGRYNSKHAIQHFEETSHCFAMDMKSQRVWDYAGDNYVHRLVQNQVDGKLIEVGVDAYEEAAGDAVESSSYRSAVLEQDDQDMSALNVDKQNPDQIKADTKFLRNKEYHLEYVQLLVSQLESQREYYESKMAKLEESQSRERIVSLENSLLEMKKKADSINAKWADKVSKLEKSHEEDTLVIEGMQANLDHLTAAKESLEDANNILASEKQDLEEQVKDLMFYLDTQAKFKDADDSVKDGALVIKQPSSSTDVKKKKKKKSRKAGSR